MTLNQVVKSGNSEIFISKIVNRGVNQADMNSLDIIIISILGYCLIRGIFRGLIKELSSIVGVLAGVYLASSYYPVLGGILSRWMSNTAYRDILSFLILFFVVLLIVGILGVIIKYLLKISAAGWLDRLLGTIFASIKGILIASVILLTLTAFLPQGTGLIKDSTMAPHIMQISNEIVGIVPDKMKKQFYNKLDELKNNWKKN
jgi:membrane protein required for colicin V production